MGTFHHGYHGGQGLHLTASFALAAVLAAVIPAAEPKPDVRPEGWQYVSEPGTTYHVDAAEGDDAHDGLSAAKPWKTLARVGKTPLKPGDAILLKRGCSWRESLPIAASGRAGWVITIGAFGAGSPPTIRGSDAVVDFTRDGDSPAYRAPWTRACKFLHVDDEAAPLRKAATSAEVQSNPGTWHHDPKESVLWVHLPKSDSPADHRVEAVVRDHGIESVGSASFVTIEGIHLTHCGVSGIFSRGNDAWSVRRCVVANTGRWGICIQGQERTGESARHCVIEDNVVGRVQTDDSQWPYYPAGIGAYGTAGAIIRRNQVSTDGVCDGIRAGPAGPPHTGHGAPSLLGDIADNEVTKCSSGISLMGSDGWRVSRNHVHHTRGGGILVSYGSDGTDISCNLIHDLDATPTHYNGIDVNINANNGTARHNTVVRVSRCSFTIEDYMKLPCNGWVVENNIFDARGNRRPIPGVPIQVYPTIARITIRNNCYVADPGFDFVGRWMPGARGDRATEYKATLAEWLAASGDDGSMAADPRFVDSEQGDFRLDPGSPCVGAAAGPGPGPGSGFAGRGASRDGAPDIGALQR